MTPATLPRTPPEASPCGARILVVEDERVVAMSLQAKLEAMGYAIVALASTGEGAISLAAEHKPELVLMDIRLQGEMDGVQAAEAIRSRLSIPVVYLTAYSTRDIIERAKVTEPYGYILKPVTDRELHVVVEMALYRHRAQQEILGQRRLLTATLQSIGDAVIATDADGRVTFMNPVAERLVNSSLEDSLGQDLDAVVTAVHELTREAIESPIRRAIREKTGLMGSNALLLRRGGGEVQIDDSAAPILDEAGDVLGGVLVFRDVTEKWANLRAISTLAAIVESSQDAVIGFTADGTITYWNRAAARLMGYSTAEVLGQNVDILTPPGHEQEMWNAIRQASGGDAIAPYDTTRLRKDGSAFAASVALSIVRDELGRATGYSVAIRDITHLRRLEEQFRQSQKMEAIGLLAGGIAHDFNNILTVVGGYSKLLLQEPLLHEQHQMVQEIREAGERATKLTHQLLAFSRKQLLAPEVVNLNEVVARASRMLRRLIGEDIELSLSLSPELDLTLVDPAQVEQVIVNLAVNARDAMPTGGRILFVTGNFNIAKPHEFLPQGRYVRLSISDTGCGMTEEVRSRLFEPFFTTKDVGKGTGLGLPMVYGFVKQSGGHITVSSEVGVGTTFEILLPRTDLPNLPEDVAPSPCLPARPGDTVLLAEDDAAVRQFAAQSLRLQGYTVLEAVNGQAAIQMAELHDGPIHLLMTDVVMPGMGGRPLAEALRARLPNIKVLYVSGYLDDDLLRHGVSNKIDNFVHKPFTHTDLCRAIHELLTETA